MTPENGPSRDALLAQVAALRALVERQRRYIGSMRASRFWKWRDRLFALAARTGVRSDPLPVATPEELAITEAALGSAYQLYQLRHRRSESDAAWLRGLVPLLSVRLPIDLVLDARHADRAACEATLTSLRAQLYPYWRILARIDPANDEQRTWLAGAAADPRVQAAAWDGSAVESEIAIGPLDAGDLLEPEALLLAAIELDRGADVVYSDEDAVRDDGVFDHPQFKPDWSPETYLSRDYLGRFCVVRSAAIAASGGVDATAGTALWYDAILRVTERFDRVAHVPRVMVHRSATAPRMEVDDQMRALSAAFSRRGELTTLRPRAGGVEVRFAVPVDERVAVIVPTRDGHALLERALTSIFEKTDHPAFEVIVVDNGSVESETHDLFARWMQREPGRFRVIRDDGPFNFSRLNNAAAGTTDAPYLLLLNNDTEVIAPDWMTAMLGQARRPSIGAVGALLLYADGAVQHAGVVLGGVLGLAGHAYRNFTLDAPDPTGSLTFDTNYLAVTGACLMVARDRFERVGGLDETFAVAFNDIDLCLKLRRAGFRNVVVPRARLFHYESKTRGGDDTREKQERAFAESEELRRRWPEWAALDPYYNPNLTLSAEDFSVGV